MSGEKLKVQVWIHRRGKAGREFLLLLLKPERGGFWQPVTGGVEAGEAIEAAALREAQEETGLAFANGPVSLDSDFRFEARGKVFHEYGYGLEAPADGQVRLDGREHTEFKWVQAQVAKIMLRHASNVEMLGVLIKMLEG